jgi:hypothetical protein
VWALKTLTFYSIEEFVIPTCFFDFCVVVPWYGAMDAKVDALLATAMLWLGS